MQENNMPAGQMPSGGSTPSRSKTWVYIVGVLVLVVVVGLFVRKQAEKLTPDHEAVPTANTNSNSPAAAQKTFEVSGVNFSFTPKEIRVKKGDSVKIVFKNTSGTHDFVVDELSLRTPIIKTGEDSMVEFVADKAGTFEYYCSVGKHRQLGMKGTLVVE